MAANTSVPPRQPSGSPESMDPVCPQIVHAILTDGSGLRSSCCHHKVNTVAQTVQLTSIEALCVSAACCLRASSTCRSARDGPALISARLRMPAGLTMVLKAQQSCPQHKQRCNTVALPRRSSLRVQRVPKTEELLVQESEPQDLEQVEQMNQVLIQVEQAAHPPGHWRCCLDAASCGP
jgi:type IV secretory pathway VirJ component